jgi:hypothetical protein
VGVFPFSKARLFSSGDFFFLLTWMIFHVRRKKKSPEENNLALEKGNTPTHKN